MAALEHPEQVRNITRHNLADVRIGNEAKRLADVVGILRAVEFARPSGIRVIDDEAGFIDREFGAFREVLARGRRLGAR